MVTRQLLATDPQQDAGGVEDRLAHHRPARSGNHLRLRPATSVIRGADGAVAPWLDGHWFAELVSDDAQAGRAVPRRRARPPRARTGHPWARPVHPRGLRRRCSRPLGRARRAQSDRRRLLDGRPDRPADVASPPGSGGRTGALRDGGRLHFTNRPAATRRCAATAARGHVRGAGSGWPARGLATARQRADGTRARRARRHDPARRTGDPGSGIGDRPLPLDELDRRHRRTRRRRPHLARPARATGPPTSPGHLDTRSAHPSARRRTPRRLHAA